MDLLVDLRYALRQLRKGGVFTVTAIATLALGIGATTTAFVVARGILWQPLPFKDSTRLVVAWEADARHGFANRNEVSFGDFLEWRDSDAGFDHLTALAYRSLNLTGGGDPERLQVAAPSVDFFDMLGVAPVIGRLFTRAEERPTAAPTAVLSHGLWVRRFGADPLIVGRSIELSGVATTVVGVLPRDFRFEFPTRRDIDVWVPRVVTPQARASHRSRALYVVGHLRPDVSAASAQARLSAVMSRLAAERPETNAGWDARVVPLREQIAGSARTPLSVLLAAGVCLLLIVCANLGTLLLARGAARRAEIAVRAAMGASAGRLLRQLLSESVVLALVGGTAGLLIAQWVVAAIGRDVLAIDLPRLHELQIDRIAVFFASAVSLVSSVAFGLVPARQALNDDLNGALRGAAGRHTTASTARQSLLAGVEVAIAVMLLIAAGLLFKSLSRLQQVDPGFDPRGVLTFQLSLPAASYSKPAQIAGFYDELMGRIEALPGVEAAGAVTNLPLGGSNQSTQFTMEGRPATSDRRPEADFRGVTPGYFRAMRLRLVAGRLFDSRDAATAMPVAIVNEAMARRYWSGDDPVGRRMKLGPPSQALPWVTIVGVVADVRHSALQSDPQSEMYIPQAQAPSDYMYVAVRAAAAGSPELLAGAVATQVHAIDPALPIFQIAPFDALVDAAIAEPRLHARLIGAFGLIALILAVGGTYGVVSYAMSRRSREIGVRLALGAQRGSVVRLLVAQGAGPMAVGAVAGTAGAFVLMRVLESMLFGVTSHDPATFMTAPLLLVTVALAACAIPAWRAANIDPVTVLRSD